MKDITSCIYCITNRENNNKYVGSAVNYLKRIRLHQRQLRLGIHHSYKLQDEYKPYVYEYSILEEVSNNEDLIKREQHYIDLLNPYYNICKIAGSSLGLKRSEETKSKIRNKNLGIKHPEWRNKIKSLAQGGDNHWTKSKDTPFSLESRLKMSNSQKELYKNGYKNPNRKIIIQSDMNDNFIKEWESISDAIKIYGVSIKHNILNRTKQAYGYKWKYKESLSID